MDLKKDEKFFNYTILQCLICSFDYIEIYKRVYLKITDVCAIIGGWIDFLFIIFQFISQYFSHKTLIGDITSNLICNDAKISINYNNNKILNLKIIL